MAMTLLEQRQIEANVLFRFRLKQERERTKGTGKSECCHRRDTARGRNGLTTPFPSREANGARERTKSGRFILVNTRHYRCQKKDSTTSTSGSEIQRTLGLFYGSTLYGVGIYHGGPDIRVSEQFLNSAYIIIGLQEVGGKAVAEGMG
jgi:hypothetical protein